MSAPMKYQKKLLKHFVIGIKRLVKFSNEKFIIRPHPSENIIFYKNEFKEFKNINIIQDGPVQQWITDCKFIIHQDVLQL